MNIRQNNNFPFEYKICIFATLADSALLLLFHLKRMERRKKKKKPISYSKLYLDYEMCAVRMISSL